MNVAFWSRRASGRAIVVALALTLNAPAAHAMPQQHKAKERIRFERVPLRKHLTVANLQRLWKTIGHLVRPKKHQAEADRHQAQDRADKQAKARKYIAHARKMLAEGDGSDGSDGSDDKPTPGECARIAVRLAPELAGTHKILGDVLWQKGRVGDAADAYREVVWRAPSSTTAKIVKERIAAVEGAGMINAERAATVLGLHFAPPLLWDKSTADAWKVEHLAREGKLPTVRVTGSLGSALNYRLDDLKALDPQKVADVKASPHPRAELTNSEAIEMRERGDAWAPMIPVVAVEKLARSFAR